MGRGYNSTFFRWRHPDTSQFVTWIEAIAMDMRELYTGDWPGGEPRAELEVPWDHHGTGAGGDHCGRGVAVRCPRPGRFYVRSWDGASLREDAEWSVGEVVPSPGVQISIWLPRTLFERGAEADDG